MSINAIATTNLANIMSFLGPVEHVKVFAHQHEIEARERFAQRQCDFKFVIKFFASAHRAKITQESRDLMDFALKRKLTVAQCFELFVWGFAIEDLELVGF